VRSLAAILAVVALSSAAAGAEEKAADGPRIRVEPESFDFGRALPGKTLRKEFTIRNFGGAELVIESISTSCGCTAALAADRRVKPGGSTPLRVTLETRAFSGRVEKQVLVRSNDPEAPVLELRVSATVEKGAPTRR
jgi:hypothetical protein